MSQTSCVAIFGGSFNPPHVGHVLAVSYLLSAYRLDGVLVIPVFDHPFDKALLPFAQRLEMAELAMAPLHNVNVSTIERDRGGESRTLYTIEALLQQQPERALRLVIGADVLADLPKWHRFDRIQELAPPIVLGRAGVQHPDAPMAVLPEVSSSQIRSQLAAGNAAAVEPLVPVAVRDYIARNRLYASAS